MTDYRATLEQWAQVQIADGPEDGVQLVRASDLVAWAAAIGKRYEVEE